MYPILWRPTAVFLQWMLGHKHSHTDKMTMHGVADCFQWWQIDSLMFAEILDTPKPVVEITQTSNPTYCHGYNHRWEYDKCVVQWCQSGPKKSASAEGVGSGSPIPLAKSLLKSACGFVDCQPQRNLRLWLPSTSAGFFFPNASVFQQKSQTIQMLD